MKLFKQASLKMQFTWCLGMLSKTIKAPKKHLRKAQEIREKEIFKDKIMEKGKLVERTFNFGFRRFFKTEEHKKREILAPHPKIQLVFKAIKNWLEKASPPHKNAFGFVRKRNPKMAVQALLGNKHFIRFDISQAFPSITMEMAMEAFERIGADEELIMLLAWITTVYYGADGSTPRRRLPQGASSSPNILLAVYQPMCEEIDDICEKYHIKWVFYADDFTFAAKQISLAAKEELLSIPKKYGLSLNKRKTKDNLGKTIPHILGLTIVEGQIHIGRRMKKKFRRIIYAAIKHAAYSPERVKGVAGEIRQIYGDETSWPGWLRKPWQEYQAEMEAKNGNRPAQIAAAKFRS